MLGLIVMLAATTASTQAYNGHQPRTERALGVTPNVSHIAHQGYTQDPYTHETTSYPYKVGPYQSSIIRVFHIDAKPQNVKGIRETIIHDAIHRHRLVDQFRHPAQNQDTIQMWVDYRTVRLVREPNNIDPNDREALTAWAQQARPEPYETGQQPT